MGFNRILAALDFSPLTSTVFQKALTLAQNRSGKLLLFHSITSDGLMTPPPIGGELGLSPHLIDQTYRIELEQQVEKTQRITQWLEDYGERAIRAGVPTEFDYQIASPTTSICQAAAEWNANLIVLGRRGRTGLTEMLLGSVSNYVLHHASCSVLIVQGGERSTLDPNASSLVSINPT